MLDKILIFNESVSLFLTPCLKKATKNYRIYIRFLTIMNHHHKPCTPLRYSLSLMYQFTDYLYYNTL